MFQGLKWGLHCLEIKSFFRLCSNHIMKKKFLNPQRKKASYLIKMQSSFLFSFLWEEFLEEEWDEGWQHLVYSL